MRHAVSPTLGVSRRHPRGAWRPTSCGFQLLKFRGTENRAAGLPAGVGWGPRQGATRDGRARARGVRRVHTVGFVVYIYIYYTSYEYNYTCTII